MPADDGDKTEPATPRRLEEARKQGQVARSTDLPAAVLMLATFLTLYVLGPKLWTSMLLIVRSSLDPSSPTTLDGLWSYAGATLVEIVRRLGPILVVIFLSVLVSLFAQVGWLFTGKPLVPSLSKVSPLAGIKRMFSLRMLMLALLNSGKFLVVSIVAYLTLYSGAAAIFNAFTFDFRGVFRVGTSLTFDLGLRLSIAMLILALLDVAWQRHKHARDLRMTKEEVKDEHRSMEGDPKLKQRRRQVQLQMAMQRLRKDVPTADVIVTNPTHFAIAIRYHSETMPAPKVVAKGADHLALRIRQIATEFGIPIVERPPLARSLYADVEVGQVIPEKFYRVVAEILAYVYELTGRSPARRTGRPATVPA